MVHCPVNHRFEEGLERNKVDLLDFYFLCYAGTLKQPFYRSSEGTHPDEAKYSPEIIFPPSHVSSALTSATKPPFGLGIAVPWRSGPDSELYWQNVRLRCAHRRRSTAGSMSGD